MDGTVRTNEETENKESYIVSSVLVEQVVNLNKEGHNQTNLPHPILISLAIMLNLSSSRILWWNWKFRQKQNNLLQDPELHRMSPLMARRRVCEAFARGRGLDTPKISKRGSLTQH